jgi:hypothetical protein
MKQIAILAGVLALALTLVYTQAEACTVSFSLAKARAGQDVDFDRFLAEAADGPWQALARSSATSLGGLSSFSQDPTMALDGGRARSLSMFSVPLRVTQTGTQSIEFTYSGLLQISSSSTHVLPYDLGAYVGYSLAAYDDQHNKFRKIDYLNKADSVNVKKTFEFEYELEAGDEIQLLFLLRTFAKLKLYCYDPKDGAVKDLMLLADFNNSFDITGLENLVVVPIPGAILLMGPALLGLVAFRRRKR